MKKLLSLLLVMLMLITTLASCSLVEKIFPKKDTVDREVTEEEWNANFNMRNFEIYSYWTVTQSGQSHTMEMVTARVIENAVYSTLQGEFHYCAVLKDDIWYVLSKSDSGKYIGQADPEYVYNIIEEDVTFTNYTYNADLGAYTKQLNPKDVYIFQTMDELEFRVYFVNNIIVKCEYAAHEIGDDGNKKDSIYVFEFRNIGTTVVDIPEFTIPE